MGQRGPKNSFTGVTCTNRKCDVYGKTDDGTIVANGTYRTRSGTVRKYICKECGTVFNDRTGTAVYDLRTNDETIMNALKLAVSGMSIRAISRDLKVNQETIRRWLERAADHSEDVETVLMRRIKVTKIELDEMWTYIQKKRLPRVDSVSDDGTWIWTSIDPDTKLIPAFHIGKRHKGDAYKMIEKLHYKLEDVPLFVSDGLNYYKNALLKMYGITKKRKNPFDRRLKHADEKVLPPEGLRYGQVVKTVNGKTLTNVERRPVFGNVDKRDITTSIIERLNLTLRQELNRFSRKTIGPSKNINHLTAHFSFYVRHYNFCRPHMSHKLGGIRYGTPAMAARITDDVWSVRKLLFFPYRNYIN